MAIISASIRIVKIETKVQTLIDIDSKLGIDMVFAVSLVAAVVVIYSGIWRQSVHKQECVWLLVYKTVYIVEYEILAKRTVDIYTVQTSSIVTACGVVFAIHTTVECSVHIQVGHRVGLYRNYIAKTSVDGPCIQALGYHFVFGGVIVMLIEITTAVTTTLCNGSVFANLVEFAIVLGTNVDKCRKCYY